MPENAVPEVRALRNLHDLITQVHSVQDLAEVLQTAAQGVVDVLGFRVAVINVVDAHDYVEAVAVAGDEEACAALRSRRIPLARMTDEFDLADEWGMLRFVPHDRLPEDAASSWVPDVAPLGVPDAWHPLDALYAPLRGPAGELLGVLSVDLPVDGVRPGPVRRQVLEMYAVQAGLALHHAQERQRLQERVRLGAATRTIVETASRELDLRRVVDQSFRPLREGFRCDWLLIRVFDTPGAGGNALGEAGATYPPDLLDRLRPRLQGVRTAGGTVEPLSFLTLGEDLARTCWADSCTCVVAAVGDTSAGLLHGRERAAVEGLLRAVDASALILVPLGDGPDCLGFLAMLRGDDAGPWQESEDDAALEVGREIGRAVGRARLYERERQLVAELQELDEYKGEMIATITHELKTPLSSILGHLELLQDGMASPTSMDAVTRNVARLQTLVEDMLLLTRIKDPHRPFVPTLVDLSGLVKEVCDLLAVQATRRHQIDRPGRRRPRRDGLGGAGGDRSSADQHRGQRREVHPGRRAGRSVAARRRRRSRRLLCRHRHRDRRGRPRHPVRGVRPVLEPRGARRPGHRARTGDRPPHRRPAPGCDLGRVHARPGQHVHGDAPVPAPGVTRCGNVGPRRIVPPW